MSIGKKTAIAAFLALSITATLLPASLAFADTNAGTNLIANGSFENADSYGFPLNWSSDGENLIPNGDFESRYYWRYNNGKLSYEYDAELNSTVGKLEWDGGKSGWNAVTMRSDGSNGIGVYWDYTQGKQIKVSTPTFVGIPIAWGEQYIPRMKMKYTGDCNVNKELLMQMTFSSAYATTENKEGKTEGIIKVAGKNVAKDEWAELGGSIYTVPQASNVVNTYTDQTPGAVRLVNVCRAETVNNGTSSAPNYATMTAWTDDARFEKLGRTSTVAASTGSKSLMIHGYADGMTEEWASDAVGVVAGETLDVKSNVRVDEIASYVRDGVTVSPEVAVSVKFDNGTVTKVGSISDVTDGFVQIADEVSVPQGAGTAQLVYTFDGKGTAYFDDAQLISFNRLANGGFESVDSKSFPIGWSSDGQNLITNGDFENTEYWYAAGSTGFSYEANGGKDGSRCGKAVSSAANWGSIAQRVGYKGTGSNEMMPAGKMPVLAFGVAYNVSMDAKISESGVSANKMQLRAECPYTTTSGGSKKYEPIFMTAVVSNAWKTYTGTFTPQKPSDYENNYIDAALLHAARITATATGAEAWVDNLSIEKQGRADTAEKAGGNKSLKIVAYDDGIDEEWTSDKIAVTANERLDISASYKTASLAGGLNISAKFYNGSAYLSEQALASSVTDTSWTDVSETVTVPSGANGMEIVFNVPGASGSAWIDNVSVTTAESEPEPQEEYTPVTDGNIYTSEDVDGERGFVASYEPEEASGTKEVEWKIIDFHDMKFTTRTQTISLDKAKEGIVKFGLILKDTVAGHDYSAMYFLR